jgi:hypothetical protein
MKTVGLELNGVGVLAAVHEGNRVNLIDLNETSPRPGWPAFVLKQSDGLLFGQPAEDHCMEIPRQVCSTFLEELSHGSSHLGGTEKSPAYSELTYYFLRDVLDRIRERVGPVDRLHLAVPPAYLEEQYGRSEKIGLLLGMVGDMDVRLVGLGGSGLISLYRSPNPPPPPGVPIIHVELFLHSIQVSVMFREEEIRSQGCHRFQQLGFIQMMRVLSDAMADRLLRETAYDVSEDRRIEQSFYRKILEVLASDDRTRETVLEIQGGSRVRRLKITQDTLRADVRPYVESILNALDRVVRKLETQADRVVLVLSDRAERIRGLEVGLRGRGFQTIVKQGTGAAAFGAAWRASELEIPKELSMISVDESLPIVSGKGEGDETGVRPVLVRAERDDSVATTAPSHVVMDGIAYSIDGNRFTIGSENLKEEFDLILTRRFSFSGLASCRLVRDETGVYLETDGDEQNPAVREAIQSGDRLHFVDGRKGADLLFIQVERGAGL